MQSDTKVNVQYMLESYLSMLELNDTQIEDSDGQVMLRI